MMIASLRVLLGVAAGVSALYAGLCVWVYLYQERLIFFPRRLPSDYRFGFPGVWEEHEIAVPGGRLNALLFKAGRARGAVLHLHGNAESLGAWGWAAGPYLRQGFDVLMVDYRGYGKSPGRISGQERLLADAEAAYRWLAERYAPDKIVLCGRSLGSGIAAYLARQHPARLLILESPYYSMADLATRVYPFLPGFLLRYPLRTDLWAREAKCPVRLIHGRRDAVIPFDHSERLALFLGDPGILHSIPGAGHDDLSEHPAYDSALAAILN